MSLREDWEGSWLFYDASPLGLRWAYISSLFREHRDDFTSSWSSSVEHFYDKLDDAADDRLKDVLEDHENLVNLVENELQELALMARDTKKRALLRKLAQQVQEQLTELEREKALIDLDLLDLEKHLEQLTRWVNRPDGHGKSMEALTEVLNSLVQLRDLCYQRARGEPLQEYLSYYYLKMMPRVAQSPTDTAVGWRVGGFSKETLDELTDKLERHVLLST